MDICNNSEGWGPISRLRPFDLTPCFEDGVLNPSLLIALVITASVSSFIHSRHHPLQLNPRSKWLLGTKLVRLHIGFFPYIHNTAAGFFASRHGRFSRASRNGVFEPTISACNLVLCLAASGNYDRCSTVMLQPYQVPKFINNSPTFLAGIFRHPQYPSANLVREWS